MTTPHRPRRLAVVGSGVAGLVAAHVAARSAHVTLFEADDRLGGHADTHRVATETGELAIDTGFIVHNRRTYPTLLRLFAELGVATQESEMSLSVRDDETGLEWAGALGRRGLFPTSAHLRRPAYLRMLTEIPRFHRRAKRLLAEPAADERTLREFLREGRFSAYFERHFMEPVVAAVWSCDPEVALDYPARYLFTFLEHHGMLRVFGSPTWRTVSGGSHDYVQRLAAALPDVRTGTKVTSVLETADGRGGDRRQRDDHHLRRVRGRHPPRPGPRAAGRPDARAARGPLGRCRTRRTPRCSTPTPRCCRTPRAPGPRGTSAGSPTATDAPKASRSPTT